MKIKVIITGSTGLVGEGVLLECLENISVEEILMINRRPSILTHPKLKEVLVKDFFEIENIKKELIGYDACFYCAGISSRGMTEADYTYITYDIAIHFAEVLLSVNCNLVFNHISGSHTDSSEKGSIMWARVKGKTENALMKLPFKKVYNFRPGFMKATAAQKNVKGYYKVIGSIYPLLKFLFPNHVSTMKELGLAMINGVTKGYPKSILEVPDIKKLAKA